MPHRDDQQLRATHQRLYGRSPELIAIAPGRVNLIGEHIDYSGGIVLPLAIDRHARVAISRSDQPATIRVHSIDLDDSIEHTLSAPPDNIGHWSSYVLGTIAELRECVPSFDLERIGLDLTIISEVPIGAGLSSSAAIEVATARSVCELMNISMDPLEMARLCQWAEHRYTGVPCGLMDQAAVAMAPSGALLAFDCRSEQGRVIDRPSGMGLIVIDTGVRHSLGDSAYRERRAASEQAASILGFDSLRDAFEQHTDSLPPALTLSQREAAQHALGEMHRVNAAIEAVLCDDLPSLGRLLCESHYSLRDTLRVSCREADRIVNIALKAPGVLGARLIGGGFGGCVLVLAGSDDAQSVASGINRAMPKDIDASIVLIDAG